jgi:hypothetical protein
MAYGASHKYQTTVSPSPEAATQKCRPDRKVESLLQSSKQQRAKSAGVAGSAEAISAAVEAVTANEEPAPASAPASATEGRE